MCSHNTPSAPRQYCFDTYFDLVFGVHSQFSTLGLIEFPTKVQGEWVRLLHFPTILLKDDNYVWLTVAFLHIKHLLNTGLS